VLNVDSGAICSDHLARRLARGFVFRTINDGFYYCHELSGAISAEQEVRLHHYGAAVVCDPGVFRLPRTRRSESTLTSRSEEFADGLSSAECSARESCPAARSGWKTRMTDVFSSVVARTPFNSSCPSGVRLRSTSRLTSGPRLLRSCNASSARCAFPPATGRTPPKPGPKTTSSAGGEKSLSRTCPEREQCR